MRRLWAQLGLLSVVLVLVTGCGGSRVVRQESWPGMTLAEDVLFVANVDQIQALDAEDGAVLWAYPQEPDLNIGFYAAPTWDAETGLLFAQGFKDQRVYAFRLGDALDEAPSLAWVFPGVQEEVGAKGQYVASGTVAGDFYLVGNGDGSLYALNVADGALVWSFATQERIWTAPLVSEDTVYLASLDHHLYALNLETGVEKWRVETRGAIATTPVLVEGKIWLADFGDRIYQIDPEGGEIVWTFEDGVDWFWATPTVGEGEIYFSDVRGNLFAFDTASNALLWQTSVEDTVRGRAVLSTDGDILYVPGYERGRIHAFETATGDAIPWGEVPANPGRLPGDLETDGERVYAMPILIEDRLQAFRADDGKLLWPNLPEP